MKTSFKVIAAVFALGFVILLGVHLFLMFGLTKAMREVVLPRVRQVTGIDVRVEGLSLNVVHGRLFLKGVSVLNPDGFIFENAVSADRVVVEVDIPSLLKQKLICVKTVSVDGALVNVVRNKYGEINISRLQEGLPKAPSSTTGRERTSESGPEAANPLPEVLIEALGCKARIRYVDTKLHQLDLVLDLELTGKSLGTQRDPAAGWGELDLNGSLGNDKTSFVTDLHLALAPVTNPASLSFDLTGRIMEIDPRIMEEVYDKLGIRSSPFGFDPNLHCRGSRFEDSSFALNLKNISMEDKLANKLGGMGSIDTLRFPVPVEGTLQKPSVDVQQALTKALGGNTHSLLDAFLKGAAMENAGGKARL